MNLDDINSASHINYDSIYKITTSDTILKEEEHHSTMKGIKLQLDESIPVNRKEFNEEVNEAPHKTNEYKFSSEYEAKLQLENDFEKEQGNKFENNLEKNSHEIIDANAAFKLDASIDEEHKNSKKPEIKRIQSIATDDLHKNTTVVHCGQLEKNINFNVVNIVDSKTLSEDSIQEGDTSTLVELCNHTDSATIKESSSKNPIDSVSLGYPTTSFEESFQKQTIMKDFQSELLQKLESNNDNSLPFSSLKNVATISSSTATEIEHIEGKLELGHNENKIEVRLIEEKIKKGQIESKTEEIPPVPFHEGFRRNICHCICLAEFDINIGTVISMQYPESSFLPKERCLEDLAIPDGAHLYDTDTAYLFFELQNEDALKGEWKRMSSSSQDSANTRKSRSSGSFGPQNQILYALVQYQVKRDKNVKRGAIQKSLIFISFHPLFSLFENVCQLGLERILVHNESPKIVLQTIYQGFSEEILRKDLAVRFWNRSIPVKMPKSGPDQEDRFGSGKLSDLSLSFGKDTMLLWFALLLQKRILLVGTPAKKVSDNVLVLPALVSPLKGFSSYMSPYVCLSDISSSLLQGNFFLVGSTNHLMEMTPTWWDICGSLTTGRVAISSSCEKFKLRYSDKEFIRSVLGGIKDGKTESWVCEQFETYTLNTLKELSSKKKLKYKTLHEIRSTSLYKRWESEHTIHIEIPQVLKPSDILLDLENNADEMPILDRIKCTFDLSRKLTNLSQIEEVCANGGVEIVASWLHDSNSQIRKYSAQILSQLLLSVKGQKSLIDDKKGLSSIIKLMDDSMPNVRVASYYCIMKLSHLSQGREVVMNNNLLDKIMDGISDKMNDIKIYCATILRNLIETDIDESEDTPSTCSSYFSSTSYKDQEIQVPSQERIDAFLTVLKDSADRTLQSHIIHILDYWHIDLQGYITTSPFHLKIFNLFMNSESDESKISTSKMLLSQIALARGNAAKVAIEIVTHGRILKRVLENESNSKNSLELRILSSQLLLRIVTLSNFSSRHLIQLIDEKQLRQWINFVIKHQRNNEHTRNIVKIIQHILLNCDISLIHLFCKAKGVHSLAQFIERQYKYQEMDDLVQHCIDILSYILIKLHEDKNWTFEDSTIKDPITRLKNFKFVECGDISQAERIQNIREFVLEL